MIKVIYLEPGKKAEIKEIDSSLKSMQQLVGGYIEIFSPFDDSACIVCNEEGKINGSELNRTILKLNESGMDLYKINKTRVIANDSVADVICGSFFICDGAGEDLASLSDEQIKKYYEIFEYPESFFSCGSLLFSEKIKER